MFGLFPSYRRASSDDFADIRQADIEELFGIADDYRRCAACWPGTATMAFGQGSANGELVTMFWRISGVNDRRRWYSMAGEEPAVWKIIRRHFFATAEKLVSRCWQFIPPENYVDERNHVAKASGCTGLIQASEDLPWCSGLNFHRFHMERK